MELQLLLDHIPVMHLTQQIDSSPRVENNTSSPLSLSIKKHSGRSILLPLTSRSVGKGKTQDVAPLEETKAILGSSNSRVSLPDLPPSEGEQSTPIPIPTSPLTSPPTSPPMSPPTSPPSHSVKRTKTRDSPKNDMIDTFQALGVNRQDLDRLNDNQFFSTLSDSVDVEIGSPLSLSSTQIDNGPDQKDTNIEDLEEEFEEFEPIGWVRAIYDYEASDEDELGFQEGDIIKLLARHDSGWWTGELNGITGLFPANHVEITYEVP